MNAPSREAVFETLRGQGVKAIKVIAADGSKANGEIRGVRKRIVVAIAISAAIIAGAAAYILGGRNQLPTTNAPTPSTAPRHQIYGDPAVMEPLERGDFTGVLANKADQMLAWFAQPGKLMCPPDVNPRTMADAFAESRPTEISVIVISENDVREARELKQIVNGMHEELSAYLANGNGTPLSYWRRLNERLDEERQIFERAKQEIEADPSLRAERNAALRNLGLRTIPAAQVTK